MSPNGIHLAGNFNDFNDDDNIDNAEYPQWDPAGIMLQDADGNGIYDGYAKPGNWGLSI